MVTQAELIKLIAEEFRVEDILGNTNVHKQLSGRSWELHINNLATTILEEVKQ